MDRKRGLSTPGLDSPKQKDINFLFKLYLRHISDFILKKNTKMRKTNTKTVKKGS